MRAPGANANGSKHGLCTDNPGWLSNDFFVDLLDMETQWTKAKVKTADRFDLGQS